MNEAVPSRDIDALLGTMTEMGASDLHIKTGHRPAVRIDGYLRRLEMDPLSEEDVAWLKSP